MSLFLHFGMKMVSSTMGFFKPPKQQTIYKAKIRPEHLKHTRKSIPKVNLWIYVQQVFAFSLVTKMKEITIKWKDTQSWKSAFSDLYISFSLKNTSQENTCGYQNTYLNTSMVALHLPTIYAWPITSTNLPFKTQSSRRHHTTWNPSHAVSGTI